MRHREVKKDHVRLEPLRLGDGFVPIPRLAYDLETPSFHVPISPHDDPKKYSHILVVIADQYADQTV